MRNTTDAVAFTIPTDGGSIEAKGVDGPGSGDSVWWINFTPFSTSGTYRLYSGVLGAQSYDFEIRADIYNFNVVDDDTQAALTYVQAPGASPTVVTNMPADIGDQGGLHLLVR